MKDSKKYWQFEKRVKEIKSPDYDKLIDLIKEREDKLSSEAQKLCSSSPKKYKKIEQKYKRIEQKYNYDIKKLQEQIYPKLRKLQYHFVIRYHKEFNDDNFFMQYMYAWLHKQVKNHIERLGQPTFVNYLLHSYYSGNLLPMRGFANNYPSSDYFGIIKDFKELSILVSPKTVFRSMISPFAENNYKDIFAFEKVKCEEKENEEIKEKIKGKIILSSRSFIEPTEKEFEYSRLTEEINSENEWTEIVEDWNKIENTNDKQSENNFNEKFYSYLSKLEKDKEFKKLLATFDNNFKDLLTDKFLKEKRNALIHIHPEYFKNEKYDRNEMLKIFFYE